MTLAKFGLGAALLLLLFTFSCGYSLGQQRTREDIAAVVDSLNTQTPAKPATATRKPAPTPTTVPATVRK